MVPAGRNGYPGVAFGGYVAGVLAGRAAAKTVRVDFRRPTPTGTPLGLAQTPDGGSELTNGVLVLAVATPAEAAAEAPGAPSWDEALAAAEAYRAAPPDEVSDCFGCGLGRTPDTGLRLHCGRVPGREIVATAWTPGAGLLAADGTLPPELVWAALDCPGNAAGRLLGSQRAGAVTASLTARLLGPVPAAGGLISYAWLLGESGRKHRVGTALATAGGEVLAVGEALWVDPRS
ncbi:hotdog fold thioesterase [Streptomyces sp. NBC_00536]|uniref:hotdog fold domain-containing protein n=1 Tax=Streptomyces sp. NBC_00536 TaxID=2975769 RepID=UPI002E8148C7|nr:hotdog fold domain-containing protein [Streptomyces sp. NBC_00536]WUC83996.1 hotdog fold thioesterase [Streptomyces sp. NBC_00536]